MPKRSSPQQIAQALSLYLAFTPWKVIAETVGLSEQSLQRRSARDNWPERREKLNKNVTLISADSSDSWVGVMRQDCEFTLKRLQTYPIPTSVDLEMKRERLISALDERARRAYGIDKQGNALTVNLNYMRDQPKQVQDSGTQKVIDVGSVKPDSTG